MKFKKKVRVSKYGNSIVVPVTEALPYTKIQVKDVVFLSVDDHGRIIIEPLRKIR